MNDELMNKMLEEINNGIAWKRTIALDFDALVQLRMVIHDLILERDISNLKLDNIEDTLHKMENWCNAYPLDIFPEPDLIKARLILESHRMSLDSISAHAMRHVVNGMRDYVQEALKKLEVKNE